MISHSKNNISTLNSASLCKPFSRQFLHNTCNPSRRWGETSLDRRCPYSGPLAFPALPLPLPVPFFGVRLLFNLSLCVFIISSSSAQRRKSAQPSPKSVIRSVPSTPVLITISSPTFRNLPGLSTHKLFLS